MSLVAVIQHYERATCWDGMGWDGMGWDGMDLRRERRRSRLVYMDVCMWQWSFIVSERALRNELFIAISIDQ